MDDVNRRAVSLLLLFVVASVPLTYGIVLFSYNFGFPLPTASGPSVPTVVVVQKDPKGTIGENVQLNSDRDKPSHDPASLLDLNVHILPVFFSSVIAISLYLPSSRQVTKRRRSSFRKDTAPARDNISREHRSRASTTFVSSETEESGCSGCSERPDRPSFTLAIRNVVMLEGVENHIVSAYLEKKHVIPYVNPAHPCLGTLERFIMFRILNNLSNLHLYTGQKPTILAVNSQIIQKGLCENSGIGYHHHLQAADNCLNLTMVFCPFVPPLTVILLAFADGPEKPLGRLFVRVNGALAPEQEFVLLFRDGYSFGHTLIDNMSVELIKPFGGEDA